MKTEPTFEVEHIDAAKPLKHIHGDITACETVLDHWGLKKEDVRRWRTDDDLQEFLWCIRTFHTHVRDLSVGLCSCLDS